MDTILKNRIVLFKTIVLKKQPFTFVGQTVSI